MAQPTVTELFESFENGLLEAEWEAVNVEYPLVADLIRQLISAGVTPKVISSRAVQIVGTTRTGMARRLENAAWYWQNQRVTESPINQNLASRGVVVAGPR